MRLAGIIALAAGALLVGVIALTSRANGGDSAPVDAPGHQVQIVSATGATLHDDGNEELLRAIEDMVDGLRASIDERMQVLDRAVARAESADSAEDGEDQKDDEDESGCRTDHDSGEGWSNTTVTCSHHEVERDGNSISISSSNSISSSTTSSSSD